MLHNIFLYILMSFCFLNAADEHDDVLLLSQISATQRVCITPLAQQRGGASYGPAAQWVSADFYLIGKEKNAQLAKSIQINWALGEGGFILAKSKKDWLALRVIPKIDSQMCEVLRMKPEETLFFDLALCRVETTQSIYPDVLMGRQHENQIYRKKIELPVFGDFKGILCISEL